MRQLHERGMTRILCEGGPTLLDALVDADLVDELCVTLAPRLAGCQPLGRATPSGITAPIGLRLDHVLVGTEGFVFLKYARG